MADIPSRGYTGSIGALFRDTSRALEDVRRTVEAYSPATPADWTGSAPTTIAEALDRIAAALGPIA